MIVVICDLYNIVLDLLQILETLIIECYVNISA